MGTVLTVTVIAGDSRAAGLLADSAIAEARRWDDALTVWRPDGELARLNAKAGHGPISISGRLALGLAAMLDLTVRTQGAFNPAVGILTRGTATVTPVPRLDSLLVLRGAHATLDGRGALDSGAIGKGLAIDAMVDLVRRGGATAAFVDFGGSSQTALGVPPADETGWAVLLTGLREGSTHGTIRLRDASLSTSRAGATDTKPILDPRTGQPVVETRQVTVLASLATDADAWSTALVVLGRDGLQAAEMAGLQVLYEDTAGPVVSRTFPPRQTGAEK